MMVRHVTQLLWKMCFGDYILPEFCHCLIFLFKKIGAGLYSPTPNIIEPIICGVSARIGVVFARIGVVSAPNEEANARNMEVNARIGAVSARKGVVNVRNQAVSARMEEAYARNVVEFAQLEETNPLKEAGTTLIKNQSTLNK